MRRFAAYGAVFCDELTIAISELAHVLENANATGLSNDSVVASGQAIYDDRSGFAVYTPGAACANDAAEVSRAAEKVRSLIQQRTGVYIAPLRPDYKPVGPMDLSSIPLWGYAVIGVVSVVALAYATGQAASIARLWKSPRKMSGYRRRRR